MIRRLKPPNHLLVAAGRLCLCRRGFNRRILLALFEFLAVETAKSYFQLNIKTRIINNFTNLLVHIISSHIPRNQLSQNPQRN